VEQAGGLVGDGLGHLRVGMTQAGHRQTGEEVEIPVALIVEEHGSMALDERDRPEGEPFGESEA